MKLSNAELEQLVREHHAKLYRFAFSLAHNEAEAADLTQQTYFKLASKGGQLDFREAVISEIESLTRFDFVSHDPHQIDECIAAEGSPPKLSTLRPRSVAPRSLVASCSTGTDIAPP
jgi:hypothetical protein